MCRALRDPECIRRNRLEIHVDSSSKGIASLVALAVQHLAGVDNVAPIRIERRRGKHHRGVSIGPKDIDQPVSQGTDSSAGTTYSAQS